MFNSESEVNEETLFLNKLLDLTVESTSEDEILFVDLYKEDILYNINQITGLLTAFNLIKTYLRYSEDLLKVEQERVGLIKELGMRVEDTELRLQQLPPDQKKQLLITTYGFFSEVILKHADLIEKASRTLVLFENSKIKFQNIINYKSYLQSSHNQLKSNHRLLFSRVESVTSSSFTIDSPKQSLINLTPVPTPISTPISTPNPNMVPIPISTSQSSESAKQYSTVAEDDAFSLQSTLELHENTKKKMDETNDNDARMSMAALLLYTSSAKELTWSTVEDVFASWRECFAHQTNKENDTSLVFKEKAHKIKRVIDNHLETSGSVLQTIKDPRVIFR